MSEPILPQDNAERDETPIAQVPTEAVAPLAWQLIEAGRYMPRRIRGSLLGRELG